MMLPVLLAEASSSQVAVELSPRTLALALSDLPEASESCDSSSQETEVPSPRTLAVRQELLDLSQDSAEDSAEAEQNHVCDEACERLMDELTAQRKTKISFRLSVQQVDSQGQTAEKVQMNITNKNWNKPMKKVGELIDFVRQKVKSIVVVYDRNGRVCEYTTTPLNRIAKKDERIQIRCFPEGTSPAELTKVRPPPFNMMLLNLGRGGAKSYTVNQLKSFCRDRGLKVTGTKPVLIKRLRNHEKL